MKKADGRAIPQSEEDREQIELTEPFQKAKAPSSARGFEILNGVRQTVTMINAALELSRTFSIE
jgi:hypothetical protein